MLSKFEFVFEEIATLELLFAWNWSDRNAWPVRQLGTGGLAGRCKVIRPEV